MEAHVPKIRVPRLTPVLSLIKFPSTQNRETIALNDLHLAEIGVLRSELNSVIDRMNGNENFAAGTISAIFAFVLTVQTSIISLVLSIMALVVAGIGIRRYYEVRVHSKRSMTTLRLWKRSSIRKVGGPFIMRRQSPIPHRGVTPEPVVIFGRRS